MKSAVRPSAFRASPLRRCAQAAAGALLALFCLAGAALAQSAADPEAIDPPGRVGSISLLAGPVTMIDLATGSQEQALLNWPLTSGWRIDTGRGGRAEVRIGSTALRLDEETTVDFARLDDRFMQIAILRGAVALRLRNPEVLNELELLTQRERLIFDEVGNYRIDVDHPPGLTAVTAFAGRVRLASGGSLFVVAAGQRGEARTAPVISFQLTRATADRFDDWVAARDARDDAIRSAAYVSRETTGVESLDEYGDWRAVQEYGAVWFPRVVPAAWAPYRYGRWVWVSPWGWSWVDEAPWGFAPLHYGRWVVVGDAWGWAPGVVVARPYYAPALVAWFGTAGVSIGVGAPIGWFPLGPREAYVPAYRHSPRYLRVVNVQHVPNVELVTIVQTPRYVHRHPDRSTWVPDDRFGRPDPVQRGQRPPPSEWRQYIARPQPPANVPGTKRRQSAESTTPTSTATPAVPSEARPLVRPPSPRAVETPRSMDSPPGIGAPRTIEAPRPVEAPRPAEPQRARPAPAAPAVRPEPSRESGAQPPAAGDDRRAAPRAPVSSTLQPASPPGEVARQRGLAPAPPTPQPPVPSAERPRARETAPMPAPVPAVGSPAPRGRGDAVPRSDGQSQSPRVPPALAPAAPVPASPPPRAAPPPAAAPGARDAGGAPPARPAPPARQEGNGERSSDKPAARQQFETR